MEKNESALNRLQKKIDSRTHEIEKTHTKRSSLFGGFKKRNIQTTWKRPDLTPRLRRSVSWLEWAFVVSFAFFIIAASFALWFFFSGNNTVSTRNVTVALNGPVEIRAGETLALQVVVTNRNAVPMELTDLVIEFPSGTRSPTDIGIELPRLRESLGTIAPGASVNRTVRAVIFGSAETEIDIKATVEYRVPSSNAIFFSEGSYTALINQSPASITVEGLEELVSGQETTLTVNITSNVPNVLQDMLLVADYPPGFFYRSASPEPFVGENVWRLGDIEIGGNRTITIRGSFSGEDGDERVVKFETGTERDGIEGELTAPLAVGEKTVLLTKPFVSASLALGGRVATEYVASRGEAVRGDIRYVNNLPGRIQDLEIIVSLNGAILNKGAVIPERGFYNSSQNTIRWDKQTNPEFADLPAGATGVLTFSLASLPLGRGSFQNPEIDLTVSVKARRMNESNVPEMIESSGTARIVVLTDLMLQSGITQMVGPVPPRVDEPTNYTVTWVATNNTNAVAGASASAVLPSYVEWVRAEGGDVAFNAVGGIVTWNIGDLAAGASKQTSFILSLTPSISQVGTPVTILSDQRVYGFDRFVREHIERTIPSLSTTEAVVQ